MFKRWVPASFIAMAMALALAGGAVLAVGGGDETRRTDVLERAAQILGIDPTVLRGAHDQARREADDDRILVVNNASRMSGASSTTRILSPAMRKLSFQGQLTD